jgi:hypothetical protein
MPLISAIRVNPPGWGMRCGLNGERKPRNPQNPYLPREAPSSAKPEPGKVAGNCMEWTSGRLTLVRADDFDDLADLVNHLTGPGPCRPPETGK